MQVFSKIANNSMLAQDSGPPIFLRHSQALTLMSSFLVSSRLELDHAAQKLALRLADPLLPFVSFSNTQFSSRILLPSDILCFFIPHIAIFPSFQANHSESTHRFVLCLYNTR